MKETKTIIFATSNQEKLKDAQYVCDSYGIQVLQRDVSVNEIQHHDPVEVALHKAQSIYDAVGRPLVVNDSFWSIPALGGFPGGYMKDVTAWLSSEDFMSLMQNKDDKTIILTETNIYVDGKITRQFTAKRKGIFGDSICGKSGPSFARLVRMEGDGMTISEIFDRGARDVDPSRYGHWHKFAKWYSRY